MSNIINQKVKFKASAKTVYEALMVSKKFSEATGGAPAEISKDDGGEFSCFGGMIFGRNIEIVPNERIVQAWRVKNWDPGVYSLLKIELKGKDSETQLSMEHIGFPEKEKEHLAEGWKANYWKPLQAYLS